MLHSRAEFRAQRGPGALGERRGAPGAIPPDGATAAGVAGFELTGLACLTCFYLASYWNFVEIDLAVVNVIGSAAFTAVLLAGCARLLRLEPASIWGPIFWFRFATAIYFGVGALAPYISNGATLVYLQQLYFFTDADILKTNLINVLCLLIFLSTVKLAMPRIQLSQAPPPGSAAKQNPASFVPLTVAFLLIGGIARYGFVLPHAFGLVGGILPSIVAMLAKIYSAGLMLLLILALRKGKVLLPIAATLILVELGSGVLTFAKTDVLITLIFVTLAFYHHKPSPARLAIGGLVALTIFSALVPLIAYGREKALQMGGGEQIATFEQRSQIVQQYLEGDRERYKTSDEVNYTLSRFFYSNAEAMVISWYDRGRPTYSLEYVLAALVPRFLWPDKPDLSATGSDLYLSASGQEGSSISSGVFAEGYGNYGWWGLPIIMIPIGLTLTLLNHFAVNTLKAERWLYLPVALICVQVGTRADGHFVGDFVGGTFTIAIVFMLLYLAERFMRLHRTI